MDISPEKINEILSDPSKLAMIANIVGSLSGGEASKEEKNAATEPITEEAPVLPAPSESSQSDSVSSVAKLLPLLQNSVQNNTQSSQLYEKRMGLLKAVRPFLSDDRKNKVDSLIKALGTAKTIEAFKGTDILSFFK